MSSLTSDFPQNCNETGKLSDPSEKGRILLGSGLCLHCELDEKNGVIVTTISVMKFGFCPSLHVIVTCAVLWAMQKLLLKSPKGRNPASVSGSFLPHLHFGKEAIWRGRTASIPIPETRHVYLNFLSTHTSQGLIPSLKHILET